MRILLACLLAASSIPAPGAHGEGAAGIAGTDRAPVALPGPCSPALPGAIREEVDRLVVVFRGLDGRAKERAARRLAGMGSRTLPYLLSLLGDLSDEPARWLVRSLHLLDDPRCAPPLMARYALSSGDLQDEILAALSSLRDPGTIPFLTSVLGERDGPRRRKAASALARMRDPRAARALLLALGDEDWGVRAEGESGLREIASKLHAVDLTLEVTRMLPSLPRERRTEALRLLASLRDPRAEETLAEHLRLGIPEGRCVCARGLALLGDPEGARYLERAVDDPDPGVRAEVVRSLVTLRGIDAFDALAGRLERDPSRAVRRIARRLLGRLAGRDLGPDVEAWRRWRARGL